MELLQLKYFCDAAKTENFSQTAKKFGVPPSDISQSIRRLERELSVSLFSRRANRVMLNGKGAEFYRRISAALDLIGEATTAVSDDGSTGTVNLCINTNRRMVMEAVERFQKQYPQIHIRTRLFSDPTDEDYDLIVSAGDERLKNYAAQELLEEELAVAVRRDSPYASGEVDLAALLSEPLITTSEKNSLFQLVNAICKDLGVRPHIAVQSDDPFYIRKCVELGLGVALVPSFSWRGQFPEAVVLKGLRGYTRTTFVYTNPQKYLPRCVKRFLDLLVEVCAEEIRVTN